MRNFLEKINKPINKHILFWIVVYTVYSSSSALKNTFQIKSILVSNILHTTLQIIVAYSILLFIIPRYKTNKGIVEFIVLLILLFIVIQVLLSFVKITFLEKAFSTCFAGTKPVLNNYSFIERISDLKKVFIYNPFFYLQPLLFLGALLTYEKQQKLSEANEQKKIAELKALKNQLNPHFLFNTLNSLYVLTLEKSDTALEVIEKLSGILDYMLYRCDDTYVLIEKEIELIENYLTLEHIRYEDRVTITFKNTINKSIKIAPLFLLTFIENAFKHGVSQELKMATVSISMALENDDIIFCIINTKPPLEIIKLSNKKNIGLTNIEKQLALLYPNEHSLTIENSDNIYKIILKLKQR